jgi:hypothetical protein
MMLWTDTVECFPYSLIICASYGAPIKHRYSQIVDQSEKVSFFVDNIGGKKLKTLFKASQNFHNFLHLSP